MTKYNKYKFDDIEIGDGVYFDNVFTGKSLIQSNYDEFWDVTGKSEEEVMLKLSHFGQDHYWTVRYDEIKLLEKPPR